MLVVQKQSKPLSKSGNPFATFTFGDVSNEEEYYSVRLQYTIDRWKDGYERLVAAEKQAVGVMWDDHREVLSEYLRDCRNAHRQKMRDFEWLCYQDKTSTGLALEEEGARLRIYELWLEDFERLGPREALRQEQLALARQREQKLKLAEAKRARQSYEENLGTLDELDLCRRDQTRGRAEIYQSWHDTVVVVLGHWHRMYLAHYDLRDLQWLFRCQIEIEEEEVREAELNLFARDVFKGCFVSEWHERLRVEREEAFAFQKEIVEGGYYSLTYELWWMAAKEVPRRWMGETVLTAAEEQAILSTHLPR